MAYIPSYNGIDSIESFLEILFADCKRSAVFPDYHKILKFYIFLEMIPSPALLLLFSFNRETSLSKHAWIRDPGFQFFPIRGAYA